MEVLLLIGVITVVTLVMIAEILHRLMIRRKAKQTKPLKGKEPAPGDWRAGLR